MVDFLKNYKLGGWSFLAKLSISATVNFFGGILYASCEAFRYVLKL